MSTDLITPGVYFKEIRPDAAVEFHTGVPAFLGLVEKRDGKEEPDEPKLLTLASEFEEHFGESRSYLGDAVQGFFTNGGKRCYVVPLDESEEDPVKKGLEALLPLEDFDLVCLPDIMHPRLHGGSQPQKERVEAMQLAVLRHLGGQSDRFAIFDTLPASGQDKSASILEAAAQGRKLRSDNAALYFPWVCVPDPDGTRTIPPCGHVAGVYSRCDNLVGVHKSPANEVLEGVLDLEFLLDTCDQDQLNPAPDEPAEDETSVNAIRALPGRGIRVWGARTLSRDRRWRFVNVRRLVSTVRRYIEWSMTDVVFEPNDQLLWSRIERDLSVYLKGLHRRGALKGRTTQEAFYVKCDEEVNPPDVRDAGIVIAEIGLAPTQPSEFILVRLIKDNERVSVTAT